MNTKNQRLETVLNLLDRWDSTTKTGDNDKVHTLLMEIVEEIAGPSHKGRVMWPEVCDICEGSGNISSSADPQEYQDCVCVDLYGMVEEGNGIQNQPERWELSA